MVTWAQQHLLTTALFSEEAEKTCSLSSPNHFLNSLSQFYKQVWTTWVINMSYMYTYVHHRVSTKGECLKPFDVDNGMYRMLWCMWIISISPHSSYGKACTSIMTTRVTLSYSRAGTEPWSRNTSQISKITIQVPFSDATVYLWITTQHT